MKHTFKAIIIDDEPAARRLMKNLLLEHQQTVQVIDEAGNGKEAIEKIETCKPDLITGFEVIKKLTHKPNIIFTTAYEQYAIKAFEAFSIDYLLKPIKEERLAQSIEKLKSFGKTETTIDIINLQEIIHQLKAPQKATALPVRTGDRIYLIRFENISYLEASDKYVYIHTVDGQKHLTDQPLTVMEEKLPEQFYRIQKSYIINKDRIKEMHKHFNGRFLFVMEIKTGARLTSGRTYYDAIKAAFGL
jgi:two-component system, LytTR family, response regulator